MSSNTIVVKVGTNVVTRKNALQGPDGLDLNVMGDLVRQIAAVVGETRQRVILVSSGAVAAGKGRMTLDAGVDKLVAKQTYASVGQPRLIAAYDSLFAQTQPLLVPGQMLLTRNNFGNEVERERILRVLAAFPDNVVPILNENDTIATDELTFGDNDQLAADMAMLVKADLLVLLTDVEGVFDRDPSQHQDAQLIHTLNANQITEEFIAACGSTKNGNGTGGMSSKLKAAGKAAQSGVRAFIANGKNGPSFLQIVRGQQVGTEILRAA